MQPAISLLERALELSQSLGESAQAANAAAADYERQKALLQQTLEQLKRPGILLSAPAGAALVSGSDLQLSASQNLIATAGNHADFSVLKRFTVAAGELFSVFTQKLGMLFRAGKGPIDLEAQDGAMRLKANQDVAVSSENGCVVIDAKQELLLRCGGSYIRLTPTGIEDGTRGDRVWKASAFSRQGPSSLAQEMNTWPHAKFDEQYVLRWPFDNAPVAHHKFTVVREDGSVIRGTTDAEGRTGLQKSLFTDRLRLHIDPD
jgi:type VI secretion system secreted protein VgrG